MVSNNLQSSKLDLELGLKLDAHACIQHAASAGHAQCNGYAYGLIVNGRVHDFFNDPEFVRDILASSANLGVNRADKTRLAKSDAELLAAIEKGIEAKAMPAFGAVLSSPQRRAVLAYIRATFGEKK